MGLSNCVVLLVRCCCLWIGLEKLETNLMSFLKKKNVFCLVLCLSSYVFVHVYVCVDCCPSMC